MIIDGKTEPRHRPWPAIASTIWEIGCNPTQPLSQTLHANAQNTHEASPFCHRTPEFIGGKNLEIGLDLQYLQDRGTQHFGRHFLRC